MNLKELSNRLNVVSDYNKAVFAIFRGLKAQKEVILDFNREQLFVDSIGSDNRQLGFYSLSNYNLAEGKGGTPFTMVDSGLFKEGLYIEFYYKTITIRSLYHTYEMIQNEAFNTTEFFGLTEQNLQLLIEDYVKDILRAWMRTVLSGESPNRVSAGVVVV